MCNQEPDENFLDFFRSLSHVPQYHPDPTTKPPSQDFLAQQFLLQQGVTYQPSTENKTCPGSVMRVGSDTFCDPIFQKSLQN